MPRPTFLLLILFVLSAGCAAFGGGAEKEKEKDKPERPSVTRVEPGTSIKDIESDPFKMHDASVQGDMLSIQVSYSGGQEEHQFTLYWSGIVARSYPGQTVMHLKHDAQGDAGEKAVKQTLEFDLSKVEKPMRITIRTDHGDAESVMYGKSRLD